MKRKMLASILALAMMLTMLPATAWAAEAADSGEAAAEAEPIAPAEEPEEPVQPEAALLQVRIDALPEADEVAALMESDPAAVDAVYEEVRALMEAVEALDGALDTARLDALVALFTPEAELLAGVNIAQIGTNTYSTVADAVSNANNGDTIVLLGSVVENIEIPAGKELVIDLRGQKLSSNASSGRATINNEGILTILDSVGGGIITTEAGSNHYTVQNHGTLTFGQENGANNFSVNTQAAVSSSSGPSLVENGWDVAAGTAAPGTATMTIYGGTFVGGLNTVKNDVGGRLTIYDGKFSLNGNAVVLNYGSLIIRNGEFKQQTKWKYCIDNYLNCEIEGGVFSSLTTNNCVVLRTGGTLTVSGGTFCTDKIVGTHLAEGYVILRINSSKYTVGKAAAQVALDKVELRLAIDETATLTATVSPEDAISTDVTWSTSDKKIATVSGGKITPKAAGKTTITAKAKAGGKMATCEVEVYLPEIAQVGDVKYTSLEEAIAVAQDGGTVTVIRDIRVINNISLSLEKSVEVDMAGHTLTLDSNKSISVTGSNGVLHLKNGTIIGNAGSNYPILSCSNGATINLTDITGENQRAKNSGPFIKIGETRSNGYSTITNCNLATSDKTVYVLGSQEESEAAISSCEIVNSSLTGKTPIAGNANGRSNVTVQGGTVEVKAGTTGGSIFVWPGMGTLTIENGRFTGEMPSSEQGTVNITGGYFTSDPSAYVAEGYIAAAAEETGYTYMVTKLEGEMISDEPATKATEAAVSEEIPSADRQIVETSAKSVALTDVTDIAGQETLSNDEKEKAAVELQDKVAVTANETITVYKQVYLKVEATGYESRTEGGETITSLTMDITPMMQLVASTAKTANDILLTETGDVPQNAVIYGTAKELTITTPTQITVTLPAAFAGQTVYIKHEAASGTYFYTGTAAENGVLTFTSQHGFSPFTFSTVNEAVAQVGSIGYPTFQAAVDAVQEGETVQILKASAEGYSASAEKTVTVENLSGIELQVTCSGETAAIPAAGSHTFTYVAPAPVWPPYVPPIIPVVPAQPAAPASELPFVDVSVQDAFYEAVKYVYDNGLMTGVDTTVFAPYGDFTRAQVATILFRLEAEPVTPFAAIFPDVTEGQWFAQAITWGNSKSILLGYDDGTFGPDNAVTMEQLLTILYRYAGLKGYDTEARADITGFDCADYAAEAVSWAAAHGMVDASNATTLRTTAARWQVAQVLSVFCQTVVLR